jgi:T-complex protein 1 subunit epsilon
MSLVFDEYGRPFIILREQQEKARIKGIEAQKVSCFLKFSVNYLMEYV